MIPPQEPFRWALGGWGGSGRQIVFGSYTYYMDKHGVLRMGTMQSALIGIRGSLTEEIFELGFEG